MSETVRASIDLTAPAARALRDLPEERRRAVAVWLDQLATTDLVSGLPHLPGKPHSRVGNTDPIEALRGEA